ncbi:phage gp46-like protein [Pseudomonas sp. SLBN-26]|uniref:phage GP46 family protein n=1 Tax=Pseudomonadaceae TaxID=135621 RepID=UPI00114F5F79|nr:MULTISPECIES: phage GP46 family protein [Pseudomonas]MCP1616563.1 phage gp46-like protein [Pseudomonas otitidis]TQL05819.1 phage gp46-like protein [Pseudomonas sp. SLBN-26]
MSDIALVWNGTEADLAIEGGDLVLEEGLQTAAVISLFSDRRARLDDVLPADDGDRRGWVGDAWPRVEGDQIGSRLWLLNREKDIPETLRRAREYARESLAWLIEDGIGASLDVQASVPMRGVLRLELTVNRRDGSTLNHQFDTLWENL